MHALEGLACRKRVAPASSPASHCKQFSAPSAHVACAPRLRLRQAFSRMLWSQNSVKTLTLNSDAMSYSVAYCCHLFDSCVLAVYPAEMRAAYTSVRPYGALAGRDIRHGLFQGSCKQSRTACAICAHCCGSISARRSCCCACSGISQVMLYGCVGLAER